MFKRLGILTILLLSTVTCLAADYNFIRVGGKYYLATKALDGTLVTKQVSVAFFDIDGTPVTPDPPGPVVPTIPEGWNGLTKLMYNSATKVTPASVRAKAQTIGDNFEAVASGLAAGQYEDIAAANADLKTKNETTVGTARDVWLPVLTEEAKAMQTLFAAGKFQGLPDYAEAYHAIADGLQLAAKAN